MNPNALLNAFNRFSLDSGIVGVALGPKQVNGSAAGTPLAVTFFVKHKLPVRGVRKRLSDGRRRLPRFIELQGQTLPTDIISTESSDILVSSARSPPQIYRAGGKASNMQLTGTLGCLVAHNALPGLYAVTNQHIALGAGSTVAFPDFRTVGAIVGTTQTSAGLIADETFFRPFDRPASYIDVDCALVRIPSQFETSFSAEIPYFGRPSAIFNPNVATEETFSKSLLGRTVFSYGWTSGQRTGTISHVYFVYPQGPANMLRVVCYLVQSNDQFPPGIIGDSGKLWMTRDNGSNLAIGIHSGVVAQSATSAKFALVTEFSSLAQFFNIRLV